MKKIILIIFLCLLIFIDLPLASAKPIVNTGSLERVLLMMQQVRAFYTIQLYASYSVQSARRFATTLLQQQTVAMISIRQAGKTLYKVIDGRFTSYQQAHYYLNSPGRGLHQYHPWIAKITTDFGIVPLHPMQQTAALIIPARATFKLEKANIRHPSQAVNAFSLKAGAYLEGGVGYQRNRTSAQTSQINIKPTPSAPYYLITYNNASHARGMGLYLGLGYRWPLSSRWSWSLGERLSYRSIEQKGAYILGPKTNYRYDINILVLNAILRLNWQVSLHNTLYGEIAGGLAIINSQNFHLPDAGIFMTHRDKEINNVNYGLAVGWLYALTQQTSLDVAIGYQDLGKASLGPRVVPSGAVSNGNVEQLLRGLNARMGLVHWF